MSLFSALPDSWCASQLEAVAEVNPKSFSPSPYAESLPVHFVPMSAVHEEFGGIDISSERKLGDVKKGYTPFLADDVLLAKITPCMENGKVALVPDLPKQLAYGSTEFHVVRSIGVLTPKWLAHFFSQSEFRRLARQNMTGSAGQMRVPTNWLSAVEVPVAPISEQTRIVEKLEELFSDLDAGVAELKAAQQKLGQYRQSLLKAAIEGRMSATGAPYPKRLLGQLVLSIGQGWSPKCENHSSNDPATWAVIKTTAIQPLKFDDQHNKVLPSTLHPREQLELRVGDLLVTRAGPRSRVGITCLVRGVRTKLILCDKAYRIRVNENDISPEFLELVLNAPQMVNAIDFIKSGINDSGLNLTQDRFFSLEIPVPPLDEQQKTVQLIAALTSEIDAQERTVEVALKQAAAQRKNILRAAFSGQLVPQDPKDEPASLLLERIRAERAAKEKAKVRKLSRKAAHA